MPTAQLVLLLVTRKLLMLANWAVATALGQG